MSCFPCVDEAGSRPGTGIDLGHVRGVNTDFAVDWGEARRCSHSAWPSHRAYSFFQSSHWHKDVNALLKLCKMKVP